MDYSSKPHWAQMIPLNLAFGIQQLEPSGKLYVQYMVKGDQYIIRLVVSLKHEHMV